MIVETQIEAGVDALWSAVERSGIAAETGVTAVSFREDFFFAVRSVRRDIIVTFRELLTDKELRLVETAMQLLDDLAEIVWRSAD